MKAAKRVVALVMIASMCIPLVACKSYKKISMKKFEEKMEEEGYMLYEQEDRVFEDYCLATSTTAPIAFQYGLCEDKSDADDYFNAVYHEIDDQEKNGTMKKTTNKITFKGSIKSDSEFADVEYLVVIRSDEMILMAYSTSRYDEYVDEIDDIIEDLCG